MCQVSCMYVCMYEKKNTESTIVSPHKHKGKSGMELQKVEEAFQRKGPTAAQKLLEHNCCNNETCDE